MASRLQQISDALSPSKKKMAPKLNENGIPSFDDLPLREGDPHHSAWGLYGDNDELGTLNRLTDERVVAAAKNEIQKGIRYVGTLPRGATLFYLCARGSHLNLQQQHKPMHETTRFIKTD